MPRAAMNSPVSSKMALTRPFAAPTGRGLGLAGWVAAPCGAAEPMAAALVMEWIDQSCYRGAGPKAATIASAAVPAKPRP